MTARFAPYVAPAPFMAYCNVFHERYPIHQPQPHAPRSPCVRLRDGIRVEHRAELATVYRRDVRVWHLDAARWSVQRFQRKCNGV